ncbi:hypothetical protein VP719_21060 [Pseudomonas protegens]|uniref:hypothetical protein n=1 Tax=Pseudomonas protegens TaxID=380021 RepID=UPI002DBC808F|nr:hypothetical protein [Pseudomonas protegens]WRV89423.1 hypothetical protein VP719_21060 [Pseudomonas protegens]
MRFMVGTRIKGVEDWTYSLELDEETGELYLHTERFGLGDDHNEGRVPLRDAKGSRGYRYAIEFLKEKLGAAAI